MLVRTLDSKSISGELERMLVDAGMARRLAAPGELIFAEGDVAEAAFYIRSGSIDIFTRGLERKRRLLNRLGEGELFGEMALLDRTTRSASAIATRSTELLVVPREQIADLFQREPRMALWMLGLSSHRLRVLTRMIAQMAEVQEINHRVLMGQELERRRIGRDMHDRIAQSVAALIMQAHSATLLLDQDPAVARQAMEKLKDRLQDSLEEIRDLMRNLFPKALRHAGLVGAIEELLDRTVRSDGMRVHFAHADLGETLPDGLEATLLCIVQEAISNLRRHAQASEVRIDLSCNAKLLRLEIQDNGRGFDLDRYLVEQKLADHYGLSTMRERANLAGGTMELESRPMAGTRLCFSIPIT